MLVWMHACMHASPDVCMHTYTMRRVALGERRPVCLGNVRTGAARHVRLRHALTIGMEVVDEVSEILVFLMQAEQLRCRHIALRRHLCLHAWLVVCAHVCVHLSVAVADACGLLCYVFDWLVVVRRMPGVLQLRERGGTWPAVIDVDDDWRWRCHADPCLVVCDCVCQTHDLDGFDGVTWEKLGVQTTTPAKANES